MSGAAVRAGASPGHRALPGIAPVHPPTGKDLTEAPFELPDDFKDEVLGRLANSAWRRYPSRSQVAVTEKVAASMSLDPRRVLLTRGCREALRLAFHERALLGHGLLLPRPSYFAFPLLADSLGMLWRTYDVEDGIDHEADPPSRRWTRVLCSPNNPTGHLVDPDVVVRTAARDGGCVLDLTYDLFTDRPLMPRLAGLVDAGAVGCLSLSKAFGLAGARLGMLVAAPDRIERFRSLADPYALDYFQLATLETLFDDHWTAARESVVRAVRSQRQVVARRLAARLPFVRVLPPTANFVSFEVPADRDLDEAVRLVADTAYARFDDIRLVRLTVNPQTLRALSRDDVRAPQSPRSDPQAQGAQGAH